MPPPPFGPDSSARVDTFPSLTSPLFFVKAKKKQEQNESEHHRKDDYKQATRTSQWAWHFQATRTSQWAWHFMKNEQRDQAWDWCLVATAIPSGISIPVTTSSREDVCFLQRV
uniref:Uncharacterized protein n=1 Tax=Triticum urartu TaxID=4572 RepID=A0A8R7PDL6_TRIUA